MIKNIKYVVVVLGVIILVLLAVLIFVSRPKKTGTVSGPTASFMSPDGHVTVINPAPGATISSPINLSGSVTGGGWFFEGTFPVAIVDADGTVLGKGWVEAPPGEWASTGTVLFGGDITFASPHSAAGTILFSKDNPSGLPQNGESFSVPVRFK